MDRAAGHYSKCLLSADASHARHGNPTKHQNRQARCETRFDRRTSRAINRHGADACPSSDLVAAMEDRTVTYAQGVATEASGKKSPSLLFVQDGTGGTLTKSTLTLTGVSSKTGYFSDRPYREAGQESTEESITLPVGRTVGMLVGIVLFPVAIGMIFRTRAPELSRRAESAVSVFGGVVLALLVVGLIWGVRDQIWDLLRQAGPATLLLNIAGIFLGLLAGRAVGLTQRESIAVAVELGIKNSTIALLVTLTLLESSTMSIPAAVYGVLMFPIGFLLAAYGRKVIPATTITTTTPPRTETKAG